VCDEIQLIGKVQHDPRIELPGIVAGSPVGLLPQEYREALAGVLAGSEASICIPIE
jgi:hypothetical protein